MHVAMICEPLLDLVEAGDQVGLSGNIEEVPVSGAQRTGHGQIQHHLVLYMGVPKG